MLIDEWSNKSRRLFISWRSKTLRGYKSYAFPNNESGYYQDPMKKCGQIKQKLVSH